MADLVVALRLTADGKQLKAEVAGVGRSLQEIGVNARQAGEATASGLGRAERSMSQLRVGIDASSGAFGRLSSVLAITKAGLAALGVGVAVRELVQAGDAFAGSLQRLGSSTANLQTAADVYDRLYRSSLQTGASVGDSVAAFTRFSVAARDIGATNDQVLKLIEGIQGFARLAGTSSAELGAATQQLGQALASGTLQGDELRSVLEAMPQLAQALAGQLGLSVGELRKAGAEGRLTADQVFPALLRASADVQRQLQGLPVTLSQGTGILTASMDRFLAQIDQAIGASRRLASGLAAAGRALDGARQAVLGPGSQDERFEANAARILELQGRRQAANDPALNPAPLLGQAEAARERVAALRRIDDEIARLGIEQDDIERDRTSRRLTEQAEADRRAAEQRRTSGDAALRELRLQTDKEFKLRDEYREREALLQRARQGGSLSENDFIAQSVRLQVQLQKELDDLNKPAGGRASREQGRSADALAVERVRRLRDEAAQFERSVVPARAYAAEIDRINRLRDEGGLSAEAYAAGVNRAIEGFNRATNSAEQTGTGIAGLDRSLQGLNDSLQQTGKETADYLAKAVLGLDSVTFSFQQLAARLASGILSRLIQDEITGPLSKAVVELAKAGLTNVGQLFGNSSPAATGPIGVNPNVAGGQLFGPGFHTGGIAGVEPPMGLRLVDANLFRGAPRFHAGGIASDEVPAILRRGEGVFTEAQMAALGPAARTEVNFYDMRSGSSEPAQVAERQGADGSRIIDITILDTVKRGIANGSLDGAMRQSYGVARRGA